jgi:hypothetical protein
MPEPAVTDYGYEHVAFSKGNVNLLSKIETWYDGSHVFEDGKRRPSKMLSNSISDMLSIRPAIRNEDFCHRCFFNLSNYIEIANVKAKATQTALARKSKIKPELDARFGVALSILLELLPLSVHLSIKIKKAFFA